MPQERQAQATHDRRTRSSATTCMARSALRRSGELARAPPVRQRRRDQQHVEAVICRIPPSRSILRRRPGRRSHTLQNRRFRVPFSSAPFHSIFLFSFVVCVYVPGILKRKFPFEDPRDVDRIFVFSRSIEGPPRGFVFSAASSPLFLFFFFWGG